MTNPIRNNLIIELHVPDLEIVKDFYSKLGFRVSMDDKPDEKNPGYLTMTRADEAGNTMLNFYGGDERVYEQSFFKQFPQDTKRGYAVEVTMVVGNIEGLYEIVSQNLKTNIVRELKELEDHGQVWKDFRMVDPFGFYLRFTQLIDWGQK
jgi:catechol 2,3-dioxygenase-like lactoylglutathione lyase family enzyme